MPSFGDRSQQNLRECHKDLQRIFNEVIKDHDCSVIEGHRPETEQNKAFHAGKSKLEYPESKHNKQPAMATDALPYPIDWNDRDRMYAFGGYVKGIADRLWAEGEITHRIRWGGDWDSDWQFKDQTFHDLPHFELVEAA